MFGDLSRVFFKKENHHSGVFVQQGRPITDADWGEQVRICQHYMRSLTEDLVGPHGGPKHRCGFGIITQQGQCQAMQKVKGKSLSINPRFFDFGIGAGHYYVDGYLCENETDVLFSEQSDKPFDKQPVMNLEACGYLVYLDVWERHIGENEAPESRDPALPIESAFRSKIIWQVKTREISKFSSTECLEPTWNSLLEEWQPQHRGLLRVKAQNEEDDREPCAISHTSEYRGLENQLYRIQVHAGGRADEATFKFSRDNGSLTFGIKRAEGNTLWLRNWGRDDRLSLSVDDWVEYVDDDIVLQNRAEPLFQVVETDQGDQRIVVKSSSGETSYPPYQGHESKHPLIRRWDHKAGNKASGSGKLRNGALIIEERKDEEDWLELENGISVQFVSRPEGMVYRTGDYWLAPARVVTGDIEGLCDESGRPKALPPHGVEHHYAPLGLAFVKGKQLSVLDWRKTFEPLAVAIRDAGKEKQGQQEA